MKRRYVVAGLAFFGFCVIYMLRVNLSVAIVAMTANKMHTHENGTIAVVRHSLFDFEQSLGNIFKHSKISKTVNSIID